MNAPASPDPSTTAAAPSRMPSLLGRLPPEGQQLGAAEALDRYLDYVGEDLGLQPYAHQEEALLELFAGRHVILNTPTGSGKTLVATALMFKAMGQGRRAWYTAPIKALVNEKFFALCADFGAEQVGMLTGDASINPDAPLICCTAEILANQVLRWGDAGAPDDVIMDEFHYYGDRDRGWAWQVPLIALPKTTFLLMSATLGDMSAVVDRLEGATGREVAWVQSVERPVPLDFGWRETALHETIENLIGEGRIPAYVVNFTRRECNELAQQLTSLNVADRDERKEIGRRLAAADLSTPFGREFRRVLRQGIGIHHAGMLPRYRRLVERLAQDGLLKVICGTDTLGVGVNIPIRTVVFSKLAKYDGRKVGLLRARDFHQIAGRAGRKGFDDRGSVIAQAPPHIIQNKKRQAKQARAQRKGRKGPKGQARKPKRDEVTWSQKVFKQLVARPPEPLGSRFKIDHGMLIQVLQRARDEDMRADDPGAPEGWTPPVERDRSGGYRFLVNLILENHDAPRRKARQLRRTAELFRGLRRAGIVTVEPGEDGRACVGVSDLLQPDFSLHQALSLWLVDAVGMLDPYDDQHALNVLSLVEATLEHPWPIIKAQQWKAKGALIDRLKGERVPYEERMRLLETVSHPQPLAEFIHGTLALHAETHPWVSADDVNPKSIAREMFEGYLSFEDYVRRYGVERSEGILLRYIGQVWRTLSQNVPEPQQSDEVLDIAWYLRVMLEQVDASLLAEWDRLRDLREDFADVALTVDLPTVDLATDEEARTARLRAELLRLVQLLSAGEWDEATRAIDQDPDPHAPGHWTAERLAEALAPFLEEYGALAFDPPSRRRAHTRIRSVGPNRWQASQTLCAAEGPTEWHLACEVDLRHGGDPHGALVRLLDVTDLG